MLLIGNAIWVDARFSVFADIIEILRHSFAEQRAPVIKDRCGGNDFSGMIITHNAEVAVMPIVIVNHRIKNEHILKFFKRLLADGFIKIETSRYTAVFH